MTTKRKQGTGRRASNRQPKPPPPRDPTMPVPHPSPELQQALKQLAPTEPGVRWSSIVTPHLIEMDKTRRMTLMMAGRARGFNFMDDAAVLSDAADRIDHAMQLLEGLRDRPYMASRP